MKLLTTFTLAAASASFVDAKYFSEGWQPGQPTARAAPQATGNVGAWKLSDLSMAAVAGQAPKKAQQTRPGFVRSLSETLTTATGYNVTGLYERVQSSENFDRRTDETDGFARVTDDNFDELVVYERFDTAKDRVTEDERAWFFFVHGPPKDPASFMFWEAVTNASIIAQSPGKEIRGLRWGRLDFITEIELTSRWLLFKPPMLVFATHRGRELRFVKPGQIAANGTIVHRFLKEELWRNLPVWESRYGPGGDRAWLPELYISANKLWMRLTGRVPSWLFVILSGMITQSVLSFMHRGNPQSGGKAKGENGTEVKDTVLVEETDEVKDTAAVDKKRMESGQTDKKPAVRVKSKKGK